MGEVEVENRRDVRIERMTVHAMAIHEGMGKLVVSRKNSLPLASDILEQYNILCGWLSVHEKVICPDNGGIESVCFVGERILCTHLNGSITVADPHNDFMKRQQICPASLWSSCAIDDSRAALVSHSATLYVFGLDEFIVLSTLALGVDQRLFCVCNRNNLIAVGAMDNIFVVKNNFVVHKLVVARKSLETHQSDVLCLVTCEGRIHAAGVDPRIISIKQIAGKDFRIIQKRNGPIRDVRAMACYDDKIYAAGEDHDIYVAKGGCHVLTNQWNRMVFLGGSLRMSRGLCFVDFWTNGSDELNNSTGSFIVKQQPVYLARLYCPRKKAINLM
ncbi:hypothetical protein KIN20_029084 [Parelaphostrongylus tenuis]|uniref:Uncharacterized protein n=1 Tax=Parelaphostrongylus tenuis TaxID=148309 RepID=A0AAD5R230_PARTN|nr:hypothetical protein KIN20_029084 [Parelaphostrongylus tenuis]